VAGAAGTLTGALGGYLGCIGSLSANDSCSEGNVAAGLLSGFGLAVATMVPLTGAYFDANGSPWVSWFGEALGAGAAFGHRPGQHQPAHVGGAAADARRGGSGVRALREAEALAGPRPKATSVDRISVVPTFGPTAGRPGRRRPVLTRARARRTPALDDRARPRAGEARLSP
jgi:hypothetical protein